MPSVVDVQRALDVSHATFRLAALCYTFVWKNRSASFAAMCRQSCLAPLHNTLSVPCMSKLPTYVQDCGYFLGAHDSH